MIPVIAAIAGRTDVPISIDTMKADVAEAALAAGASFVNDVTALRGDPRMAEVVAAAEMPVCLMHMLGEPRTMQDDPRYDDVVAEVATFLSERAEAVARGRVSAPTGSASIPGIGFGKTLEHNLELLRRLDEIVALGYPVVVGVSRKRFLGAITGAGERDRRAASLAASLAAAAARGVDGARARGAADARCAGRRGRDRGRG